MAVRDVYGCGEIGGNVKIRIEITEEELKKLVIQQIEETLGSIAINENNVHIQVKSKQNYKSEWESASFRAIYES